MSHFPVSSPSDQQMDRVLIAQAAEAAANAPNLFSFLVLRNGHLIQEYYAPGKTEGTKLHVRSVTKSISSILIGIAIDQCLIEDPNQRVLDYFPDLPKESLDPAIHDMTLEHLLTMTSGFAWDEGSEEAVIEWFFGGRQSAITDVLTRPVAHKPGHHFNYDSPSTDLLATILAKAVQCDLPSFAIRHLFAPLDIHDFEWERDPAGYFRGSAGLEMRPMDMAKIGQLVLQQGRWQDQQIVSQEWIAQSVTTRINVRQEQGYGRLWWVKENEPPYFYGAVGYGGQFIFVVPERQIVVVANHEWWNLAGGVAQQQITAFYEQIFAKVLESAG